MSAATETGEASSEPDHGILDPSFLNAFADWALAEDVGRGDITTQAVVPEDARLEADIATRQAIVVAGMPVAEAVFRRLSADAETEILVEDGERAGKDAILGRVRGPARALLTAERTALNILQHLSGIATLTRAYVDAIEGTGAILLDTRKTVPGLRRFAKYATRMGGARNHRMGLDDAILIKDNHVAIARHGNLTGIRAAVAAARAAGHGGIEVECDSLAEADEALAAGADRILLDNMSVDDLGRAVALAQGRVPLEASGNVTLENIRAIAETGVDFISVGRITLSAPAADIGLDYRAG